MPTDEDRIATAIGWAKQFRDLGIPQDLTASDAMITAHVRQHSVRESTDEFRWPETEWTIVLRGVWVIELDLIGIPKGPPRRIR